LIGLALCFIGSFTLFCHTYSLPQAGPVDFGPRNSAGVRGKFIPAAYFPRRLPRLLKRDWSADGKRLYASSQSAQSTTLLYIDIDLEGHARVLRQQAGIFKTWGIPSPDGRHLAFLEWTSANNVWMIENF
jgi:hypothetical protein